MTQSPPDQSAEEQIRPTSKDRETSKVSDVSDVCVKNRRQMYLEQHPSYFESPDLELADPLLYDRCIRRFQSASEREAEGRAKGYSGVLEADLYRSEAKLAALSKDVHTKQRETDVSGRVARVSVSYVRGKDGQIMPEDPDEIPKTKGEGFERWKFEMMMRFLRGDDSDFAYEVVDQDEGLDYIERRDAEERWFDDEEADAVDPGGPNETGVQDF